MDRHPMTDVPLKAKIFMENYQNSGSLEWKDCEKNRFNLMVMENDKLTCWTMKFEKLEAGWGNKLIKEEVYDDIIVLDTSDFPPEIKSQLVDGGESIETGTSPRTVSQEEISAGGGCS